MKDNRETKKASSIWRSRSFCVLATTIILWVWGDIAQPQATSCQVGTYDCAGQLYLYNGKVGIGVTNPDTTLHVAGTGAKLRIGSQDTTNEGGEIQLDGAGSNTEWIMDNYQSKFRLHHGGTAYMNMDAAGNLGIAGSMTNGTVPVNRSKVLEGSAKNLGAVTLNPSSANIIAGPIDLGTLNTGDYIYITIYMKADKGGTAGSITSVIRITGGATIDFGVDVSPDIQTSQYVAAFNSGYFLFTVLGKVTTGGTGSDLYLRGNSQGSDATVTANNGQIHALVLKGT